MDNVIPILSLIAILGVGWYLLRPPVVFVIRYRGGKPKVIRGHVGEMTLKSIDEVCQQDQVQSATIMAIPTGKKRFRLKFSGNITPGCQQQLRNMVLAGSMNDSRLSP